nr:hypothetical protein [Tanacetum cinerariifolium]
EASDFDNPSFPRPPPEPPDAEFELDEREEISAVMKNIDKLNEDECFDPGGDIDVYTNDKDVDYFPFIIVTRIFLSYLIYPEIEEISRPLMPIHIAEEERTRREHGDYISRMEMLFTINPCPRFMVNTNMIFKSLPSSFILVQDNDSQ